MQEPALDLARPRVPVSTVLASIVGLWACYFVLTTIRAEILDLGFEFELLWRRAVVALIGVAVTFAMWLILRQFDHKPLWAKVAAALVISAPVSIVLAQANRFVFADLETEIAKSFGEKQGFKVRRDESGNLLVDIPVPTSHAPQATPTGEETDGGSGALEELPQAITINTPSPQDTGLPEIALGRYFLMLAWCALYLALVAGEQARTAERREGAFRRAAKAAELRSLRYQVNPHFLFNTLNSLSALVLTGRNQQAERMIQMISTFYRSSLADDPTSDVPLRDEFGLQRLYLDIEAVRFPDRLVAVYDLPAALEGAKVPGMILQPLVENSVKHAVAPSAGKVTITLSAREEYGRLVITVSDDGKGKRAAGPARPTDGYGIGLQNVRERLEARFGEQASIVSGPTGSGYATHIRIPLLTHRNADA
ncbi:histidine kinase [Erythrobacter sp. SG61-1L]|uniref:sensor histidine kinase n=1 Tax=Erythrobacter sp. SG61-1L TaxID=1603897 RepID=UPI0006C924E9|nr:histidine kinase [Erythrobacter sp. SG61-1L]KPL69099.1 histidine kinase [Erythrobacter sp. SG61-1L]